MRPRHNASRYYPAPDPTVAIRCQCGCGKCPNDSQMLREYKPGLFKYICTECWYELHITWADVLR